MGKNSAVRKTEQVTNAPKMELIKGGKDAVLIPEVKNQIETTKEQNVPSIEELQAKGLKIFHLTEKYKEIKRKIEIVDRFSILHDKENAQLTIVDTNGEEIQTRNPKSIKQVLEIWRKDLGDALNYREAEIRDLMLS